MRRFIIVLMGMLLILGSCAVPSQQGPDAGHGLESALRGIGHLVLSPFQIAAGLLEGIAAMPYFISTNIHEINKGMIDAQAKITLDDTYESAYGKRITQIPETGDTGEVFRRMKHATQYFQKVLRRYGIHDADRYILTSIDTANTEGFTLFAVVHRPSDSIRVIDKYNKSIIRQFTKSDRLFFEPYEKDINGRALDTVVDWAGMPREYIKTQKAQAILMTIAANSIIEKKSSPEYWEKERLWIAGDFRVITAERMNLVRNKLGL